MMMISHLALPLSVQSMHTRGLKDTFCIALASVSYSAAITLRVRKNIDRVSARPGSAVLHLV